MLELTFTQASLLTTVSLTVPSSQEISRQPRWWRKDPALRAGWQEGRACFTQASFLPGPAASRQTSSSCLPFQSEWREPRLCPGAGSLSLRSVTSSPRALSLWGILLVNLTRRMSFPLTPSLPLVDFFLPDSVEGKRIPNAQLQYRKKKSSGDFGKCNDWFLR